MKIKSLIAILALIIAFGSTAALAKVQVATTTTDLACIARSVGGSKVNVVALSRGDQDTHYVDPRPSMVNNLRRADLFVRVGMDHDIWSQGLMDAARNRNIITGAKGHVDASAGIRRLEVPTERVDASQGHIHIYGNPHYWLDPLNGKIIARNILQGLIRVSPGDEAYFRQNYNNFCKRIDEALPRWQRRLSGAKGKQIVTYHKSFAYFNQRFGLREFGNVEPLPGIPPSPSHANNLIRRMNGSNVKTILMESFYPRRFPDMIARETGGKVVPVATSVGGARGVNDYFGLFDHLTDALAKAL